MGVAVAATVLISQLPNADAAVGGLAGVPPAEGLAAFHDAVAVLLLMAAGAVFFAFQVQERPAAAGAAANAIARSRGLGRARQFQ